MRSLGFTLVELIVVIVILGIVSISFSNIISQTIGTYVDATDRQALSLNGRMAVDRIARELRDALPISIRVSSDNLCIEYLPIAAASRYINLTSPSNASSLEVIDFDLSLQPGVNYYVVIYPIQVSEVYDLSSDAMAPLTSISDPDPGDNAVTLNLGLATLYRSSPGQRVYIVSDPISFCALGDTSGRLNRYEAYGVNTSQPTSFLVTGSLLLENVQVNDGSAIEVFRFFPGTLQRNSVVALDIKMVREDEQLALSHEVFVRNVP